MHVLDYGYGDPQTWGGRHYDAPTKHEQMLDALNDELRRKMYDTGFRVFWDELSCYYPELVDKLLEKQLIHRQNSLR